jgi:hypothetical protein
LTIGNIYSKKKKKNENKKNKIKITFKKTILQSIKIFIFFKSTNKNK